MSFTSWDGPIGSDPTDRGFGGGGSGDVIGAAIAAGAGLYDSYQNRKAARENTDKNIAAAKREAELAYQRSVEMWHMQNAYNSPQSQMQRFIEGGLNPHLIYGQGSSGLANSAPQYNPARQEHNYVPMHVSPGLTAILPTLMSVGTWMQNMRLSEAELKQRGVNTMRQEQLIDYLTKLNPKLLEEKSNKLSLFETQAQTQGHLRDIARTKLLDMSADYRTKYGDELWQQSGVPGPAGRIGGLQKLKFMQEFSKEKLLEAKSSWADMDITDPQAIMMMVMQSVLGMAGAQLRMRPGSAKPAQSQRARPTGVRRIHPSRRVQYDKFGRYLD